LTRILTVVVFVVTVLDLDVSRTRLKPTSGMAAVHTSTTCGGRGDTAAGPSTLTTRRQNYAPTGNLADMRCHLALDWYADADVDPTDSTSAPVGLSIATVIGSTSCCCSQCCACRGPGCTAESTPDHHHIRCDRVRNFSINCSFARQLRGQRSSGDDNSRNGVEERAQSTMRSRTWRSYL